MKKRYLFFLWEFPQLFLAFMLYFILRSRIIFYLGYKDTRVYVAKGFPGGISLAFMIFLDENRASSINAIKHEYGHSLQSLF